MAPTGTPSVVNWRIAHQTGVRSPWCGCAYVFYSWSTRKGFESRPHELRSWSWLPQSGWWFTCPGGYRKHDNITGESLDNSPEVFLSQVSVILDEADSRSLVSVIMTPSPMPLAIIFLYLGYSHFCLVPLIYGLIIFFCAIHRCLVVTWTKAIYWPPSGETDRGC